VRHLELAVSRRAAHGCKDPAHVAPRHHIDRSHRLGCVRRRTSSGATIHGAARTVERATTGVTHRERTPPPPPTPCGGDQLRVAFYNAGQALAALVTLPDGRYILVDTGESPTRAGCGAPCKEWHRRVMAGLAKDLGGAPIDILWLTHPHSDHIGGAVDVLTQFTVAAYVDNGRDLTGATVARAREAAQAPPRADHGHRAGEHGGPAREHERRAARGDRAARVVPQCGRNANACSILLRVDYGSSSVLFTGDAEDVEEADVTIGGAVTLLQVGHHGSATSSTAALLDQAMPKYAVISSGAAGEGTNRTYCHPRAATVHALVVLLSANLRRDPPARESIPALQARPERTLATTRSDYHTGPRYQKFPHTIQLFLQADQRWDPPDAMRDRRLTCRPLTILLC
jgi:competence protein ComEC